MPEQFIAIVVSPQDKDGTTLLLEPRGGFGSDKYYQGICGKGVPVIGVPVIIFGTDDVQAEYERLKAINVRFTQEPTKTDRGTQAIFDGTSGNNIQIHQT